MKSAFYLVLLVFLLSMSGNNPIFPLKALTDLEGKTWTGKLTQVNHQTGETTLDSVEFTATRTDDGQNSWNWKYHFPGKEGFDRESVMEWKKKGKVLNNQQIVEQTVTKTGNYRIIALENQEEKELRHIYQISPFFFSHEIATLRKENDQFIPHWKYECMRERVR